MGVVRRMAKNTASLTGAKIISLASSMVFSIFAARSLGELHYGMYAFVIVLTSYFLVTSEYGLENLIVRDVADRKEMSDEYLSSSILIKTFTCFLSLLLMLVVLFLMRRQDILTIALWAGAGMIPAVFYVSVDAIFRAHEKMLYIAIIDIVYSVIRSAIGIMIVLGTRDLVSLFQSFFLVEILRFALAVMIYNRKIGRFRLRTRIPLSRKLFRSGFSMGYWRLLGALYGQVDILILSIMLGDITVGWFKASRNITDMLSVGSMIVINVIMPVMTVIHSKSLENFRKVYTTVFKYILVGMLPVMLVIAGYAEEIILLLYGPEYANSIPILKYFVWTSVIHFLLALIGTTMIIIDKFRLAARLSLVMVALRILITVFLIDRYGYMGVCYAAIAIGVISLVLHIPIIYASIGNTGLEKYGWKLLAVLGTVALFYGLLGSARIVGTGVLIPVAIALYIVILVKFNVIDLRDVRYFRYET
jgi:O-antigen/teichoic acid export membrane protein